MHKTGLSCVLLFGVLFGLLGSKALAGTSSTSAPAKTFTMGSIESYVGRHRVANDSIEFSPGWIGKSPSEREEISQQIVTNVRVDGNLYSNVRACVKPDWTGLGIDPDCGLARIPSPECSRQKITVYFDLPFMKGFNDCLTSMLNER